MPNHVTHRLTIKASKKIVDLIRKKVCTPDSEFDANRIIALPEMLHHTSSDGKVSDQKRENIRKYGFPTWYEWANHWWGTKWGCYEARWEENNIVHFLTAWSPAIRIIHALSQDFPEAKFIMTWADEDVPCGVYIIKDGEISEETFEQETPEWVKHRKELGCYYEDEEDEVE